MNEREILNIQEQARANLRHIATWPDGGHLTAISVKGVAKSDQEVILALCDEVIRLRAIGGHETILTGRKGSRA